MQTNRDGTMSERRLVNSYKIYSKLMLFFIFGNLFAPRREICVISEASAHMTAPKKTFVTTRLSDMGQKELLSRDRERGKVKKYQVSLEARQAFATFSDADGFPSFHSSPLSLTSRKNQNRFFCVKK